MVFLFLSENLPQVPTSLQPASSHVYLIYAYNMVLIVPIFNVFDFRQENAFGHAILLNYYSMHPPLILGIMFSDIGIMLCRLSI